MVYAVAPSKARRRFDDVRIRRVRHLLVVGESAHLMIGVEQRFRDEGANVRVASSVEDATAFLAGVCEPAEPQPRQVLADCAGVDPDPLGQGADVELVARDEPQQFEAGGFGEHRERGDGGSYLRFVGQLGVWSVRRYSRDGLAHGLTLSYSNVFADQVESAAVSHTATCERHEHVDVRADNPTAPAAGRPFSAPSGGLLSQREVREAALSVAFFLAALVFRVGHEDWPSRVLFAGCYGCGGWGPALSGLRSLRRRSLDVDLLMVVAALVAMSIGQVVDGALLIVIFSTSSALEAISARHTRDAVRGLLRLTPERASLLRSDDTEVVVEAEELEPGDVIVVRPGERIGADGRVLDGASDVDEASITGEPLPVPKLAGADVFAGTLNGSGSLRVEVTRSASESVVARMVAMVEQASEAKAVTQLFIDRVEQRYSVAMVAVTLALFVVPLVAGAALQPTLVRAMTFMIVASPCAVVLATMPALLAAIANAGRHGVLVKSAVVMEQLGQISQVAFDKTGTLTRGTPRLESVRALTSSASAETVLGWAAAAEHPSEHPLARAIVAGATDQGVSIGAVAAFYAEPGRGVRATVDGRQIAVSRPDSLDDVDPLQTAGARAVVEEMEALGHTAMVVAADGIPVGVLAVTDQVRPDAAAAVSHLELLTGAPAVLLTGDNDRAAKAVADSVGIVAVRAQLLPREKVATVRELESGGRKLAVVGDGVNDAPALAAAHLGVAMGRRGSDLTLEAADVVMVRDELSGLPAALKLSRHARRVVKVNLAFAGVVILALAGLDLTGHLPLPLGVAGHEGSTVVVGLNGLRLLRDAHWRPDPSPQWSGLRRHRLRQSAQVP